MKSEEDKIIRPGHEDESVQVTDESVDFVPAYQPETMTKITVPNLPDDARGMSAEALAKIPTLTEQQVVAVLEEAIPQPVSEHVPTPVLVQEPASEDAASPSVVPAQAELSDVPQLEFAAELQTAQDTPPETDSWLEQCQIRIGHLGEEIQKLNDRLDQLEQTTKV
jgi:hypothetical protein